MTPEEQDTEEKIFEAACQVFQRKGFAGARMQEIADEADINKSMLHYYYRSKDQLFQQVYQREMSRFFPVIFEVLDSDMPFDEKLESLIEAYYTFLNNNPRMAQFIIHEMNQNPKRFREFVEKRGIKPPPNFYAQIEEDVEHGRMDEVDPHQLMASIVSLIFFPFLTSTMIKSLYDFDEQDFINFLKERKSFLINFILNGINYNRT